MADAAVLLSGMLAGDPGHGGATWAVLQWLLGLRRLGHAVTFVEPVDRLTPERVVYFDTVVAEFGLAGSAALAEQGTRATAGMPRERIEAAAREADVLVNISGLLRDPELVEQVPVRLYVDLDPGFNQLWHEEGIDVGFGGHTHYATVGQALGRPACPVPTCGVEWRPVLPPVLLERWPVANGVVHDALTTVANWRAYGSIERDGVRYGQKAHSLRGLVDLPRLTDARFLLALAIHEEESSDLEALARHGWELADPQAVAATPSDYRRFVQGSKAEFGLAKEGYVAGRTGWVSDRSACYLASGRPVVAQDTGFAHALPCGEGLLRFSTAQEAVAAVEEVERDYERHRRAARRLAEERLDSDLVLGELLAWL